MKKELSLLNCKENRFYKVKSIKGTNRFIDRVGAIGITLDTKIHVMQNEKKQPILLYARNTMIAINRDEGKEIYVYEEVS